MPSYLLLLNAILGFMATTGCGQSTCCNNGPVYCLNATKDVWLEGGSNKNSYGLIIGKHPEYPKKRSLVQFGDIPSQCGNIVSAKLYLKYWYSHKASWQNITNINRTVQVHQVKQDWTESQATSTHRKTGIRWSKPYLALDGTDANPNTLDTVIFPPTKPWLQLDITEAARNWKNGEENYGVVIWATNENDDGWDIRFRSREHSTDKPFLSIFCN
ncbi:PREDICTED: uncharacterized protein LOC109587965 [Amphimedon queenslandica]|uniref:Carbohydrate-binding module family 96 domain-containing protein n=1 Tax=Amphimedon queenslandica TaxID=400682 RepID=A0A1X7TGC0_AMPQE|nr:PREDICTED: uncharacterized protein LOC109587965 [Amphimedon queenslandica]|eukprot:XP_019859735.1 PREDICTED: uncharacterized protein LOC109587965 [Amphimedon queenslandica]